RLHGGAFATLAQRRCSCPPHLDAHSAMHAPTRNTLSRTLSTLHRNPLLAKIEEARIRAAAEPDAMSEHAVTSERSWPSAVDPLSDEVVRAVVDLRSNDATKIRAALHREIVRSPLLVGHVLELLARDDV